MTCLYILDSYVHLISDSCNTGDCAVTLDSFSLTVCIISPWQSSSPGEPGNRGDDSSSSHVAAGLISCDINSDVCRNRKRWHLNSEFCKTSAQNISPLGLWRSRCSFISTAGSSSVAASSLLGVPGCYFTLFCWYCGFVQMRAALIQVQTTISWSDSGLKTASRRNKTSRTSSLTSSQVKFIISWGEITLQPAIKKTSQPTTQQTRQDVKRCCGLYKEWNNYIRNKTFEHDPATLTFSWETKAELLQSMES